MKYRYLAFFAAILFSAQAYAKYSFGEQDRLHPIQDVAFKGPKGESLYLGYRTTAMNVFAGVYLKDQGYVLGIKEDTQGEYFNLTPELLANLQADGSLPTPLPKYEVAVLDYLMGYSLWLILIAVAAFYGAKAVIISALRKRSAEPTA